MNMSECFEYSWNIYFKFYGIFQGYISSVYLDISINIQY